MSLNRYLGWFALTYLGAGLVLAFIGTFLDIGSGASAIVPMIAAMSAGDRFVRDHGRIPTSSEKWALVNASFAIAVVLTAVTILAMVLTAPDAPLAIVDAVGWVLTVVLLIAGLLVTYGLIWFGYGWLTSRTLRNRTKRVQQPS
ncbi:ABZJ_00895 family protein [Gordonia sp. NPDC062954]|jgi:hypothetical protein|uniref:ABZJ_00895 family protein n=1 Tax=Gordonia sp. NPDC062954 TaxID=3364003 RepID=UPI0037C89C65